MKPLIIQVVSVHYEHLCLRKSVFYTTTLLEKGVPQKKLGKATDLRLSNYKHFLTPYKNTINKATAQCPGVYCKSNFANWCQVYSCVFPS